jgi:hypothetical protein
VVCAPTLSVSRACPFPRRGASPAAPAEAPCNSPVRMPPIAPCLLPGLLFSPQLAVPRPAASPHPCSCRAVEGQLASQAGEARPRLVDARSWILYLSAMKECLAVCLAWLAQGTSDQMWASKLLGRLSAHWPVASAV